MNRQLALILAIGLGVPVLIGLIYVLQSRMGEARSDARRSMAEAHGWSYTESEDGTLWRITGTHRGASWVCDARRPRRSGPREHDVPHRTRFVADVDGGGVLLGPPVPEGLAGRVVRTLIELTQVPAARSLQREGETVALSGSLGEHYQATVTSREALERFTAPPVSDTLGALAGAHKYPPIITWYEGELTVTVGEDLRDAQAIEGFIERALAIRETLLGG